MGISLKIISFNLMLVMHVTHATIQYFLVFQDITSAEKRKGQPIFNSLGHANSIHTNELFEIFQ